MFLLKLLCAHNSISIHYTAWCYASTRCFLDLTHAGLTLKLFYACNLNLNVLAEILNVGKRALENEFAAIMAMDDVCVVHRGSGSSISA
jgi:hypothetical protein